MAMGTKASHPPQRCSLESSPTQYEDDDSNKRSYVIILLSNSEEMTWDNITEAFYYPKWTEPLIFRSQLMGNGSSLLRFVWKIRGSSCSDFWVIHYQRRKMKTQNIQTNKMGLENPRFLMGWIPFLRNQYTLFQPHPSYHIISIK